MARNYAVLLHEYLEEMDILSDAEFGRLCRALLAYSADGREVQLEGVEKVLWKRVKKQEDRFQENYEDQIRSKRNAGKKGAAKRWQTVSSAGIAIAEDCDAIDDMAGYSKNGYKETETKTKISGVDKPPQREEAYASCAESEAASAPAAISLPLNDGTEYPVTEEQCQEWAGLYPAVDVIQQLRGMRGWLNANPQKRKTRRGVNRFINAWLAREQDRGNVQRKKPSQGKDSWTALAEQMDRKDGVF